MHLVFGIGRKRIKTRLYIKKSIPLYTSFVLSFQAGLNIPRKTIFKKNSILTTLLPTLFFSGCNMNHTFFYFAYNSLTFVMTSVHFHFAGYYVICFVADWLIGLVFNNKLQILKNFQNRSRSH